MKQITTDFFSITEIGGVGKMVYKAVRFPECVRGYDHARKGDTIVPICTIMHCPESGSDYSITGQDLLVSICNLYKEINAPDYSVSITDMVWDWCHKNMQSCNIAILCEMVEEDYSDYNLSGDIVGYGTFDVSDFAKDLCKLGSAFGYYVLQKVCYEHDVASVRALYYEGRIYDSKTLPERFRHCEADEKYLKEFNEEYH